MKKYINIYLLFVFVLVIFSMITTNSKYIDAFNNKKSMAIILRGEAFRSGSQHSRNIGAEETYEEQKVACATHNKLAEKIESLGYNVDIYIDTYSTKYDNDLLSWYGSRVKGFKFHKIHLESQEALIKNSIDLLEHSLDTYDVLLILRLDLFLKDQYINEYNPEVQTIQFISRFVSVLGDFNNKTPKGNDRINDMIFHYPKKYYNKIYILYTGSSTETIIRMHDMLDYTDILYYTDYTFLTENFYDPDSQKDLNPYYRIINRPENTVWHDEGRQISKDF